ncbi:MAG: Hint domain-containing protein [Oligoflexales bacterium]
MNQFLIFTFLINFYSLNAQSRGVSIDTTIMTKEGDMPIELLDMNHEIISYHNIFCLEKSRVKNVDITQMKIITIYTENKKIEVSEQQKMMTIHGWEYAKNLNINDSIITFQGSRLITGFFKNDTKHDVYSITSEPHQTFFANGFLLKK